MRIILLANNWVGKEIATFLSQQSDVEIVALGIHEPEKQHYTDEIKKLVKVPKRLVFTAPQLRDPKVLAMISRLQPDLVVAAFWGYILRPEFLAIPSQGTINFHPGYLPKNRGVNPNVWPFLDGSPAGVTIHYVDNGIDTGDIIARRIVPITATDTAGTVYEKTLTEIVDLFYKIWPALSKGKAPRIPQNTLPETPTFHTKKDLVPYETIDLNHSYTGKELIQLLKARSYDERFFLSFLDQGKKVYIKAQLSVTEKQ